MKNDNFIVLEKKVVRQHISQLTDIILKTISINPNNPLPYVEKEATPEATSCFSTKFGTLGYYQHLYNTSVVPDLLWKNIKNYDEHEYEIAVVLVVNGDKITVYGEKTDKEIDVVCDKNNILTPFAVKPEVGHEMLLKQKPGVPEVWNIVHNITLAKLKQSMWTKMK